MHNDIIIIIQKMLDQERNKASFSSKQLSYALYGCKEKFQRFLAIQQKISSDPILRFDPSNIQSSRKHNMMIHAKKLIRYHESLNLSLGEKVLDPIFFTEQMPLSLHFVMFLLTLKNLCTEKQVQWFLEPALRGEILGCYAQTELAHGSDIQNLMTTATFDETTQTFVIDSNGIGGAKWWIGDLGVYATHAAVFAQLIIRNKNYGLHTFLVPIRDNHHKPFPGVELGDVGPKYGYNSKDNGYALFTKYRIPMKNMLMKYAKVTSTGQYNRRGNERISYATMLNTRTLIPQACASCLSKAIVITTRYSLVRKQFKDSYGKQIPILNYQLQLEKIIPRISQTIASRFASQKIKEIVAEIIEEANKSGTFTRLNEIHALSSGIKSVVTHDSVQGLQTLRRSAGGHGFHMYSGLPHLLIEVSPTTTFQGQNTILLLQVTRFLLKSLKDMNKGKRLASTVMYLEQLNNADSFLIDVQHYSQLLNPETIRKIFLYHSCQRVKIAGEKLSSLIAQGVNPKQAWDYHCGLTLVEAGISHTYYWIFHNFYSEVYSRTNNEKVRAVLFKLLCLYGIEKILQRSQSFFETGVISSNTIKFLNQARQQLFKQLRPQALTIVQSFGYDDNSLHSAIGGADGKAYERLLDWSKKYNIVNEQATRNQIYEVMKKAKQQIKAKL